MTKKCEVCKKVFHFYKYRKDVVKFCSVKCHGKYQKGKNTGENSHSWKGGTSEHSAGYLLIYKPEHPHANTKGYVAEHTLVAEKHAGRYVNPKKEHVHHIDGNKKNNVPENLIILTHAEHRRTHAGWKVIDGEWWKPCEQCKKFLLLKTNFYFRSNGKHTNPCISCSIQNSRHQQQKNIHTVFCAGCGKKSVTCRKENTRITKKCSSCRAKQQWKDKRFQKRG